MVNERGNKGLSSYKPLFSIGLPYKFLAIGSLDTKRRILKGMVL